MAIHNITGIRGAEKLGLSRVILARELTCEEIQNIKRKTSRAGSIYSWGALLQYLRDVFGQQFSWRGQWQSGYVHPGMQT